ncbi:hypothetical protein [Rhizobium sp. Root1203]|uniref:hypothetical protein n=1 Tax=Rhizobium sp. Root1203 TaxID=1736427 RepID=UPI000AEC30EC|nr:hypothetical protein [Rhizobium sp. Root1203]
MAVRPLLIGIFFVIILVGIALSIIWIDKTQPLHQRDPLAPSTVPTEPIPTPAQ